MTLDDSYREMCLEVENLRASLARKVRHCDELTEERDQMERERDEARAEHALAQERFENAVQIATRHAVERDKWRDKFLALNQTAGELCSACGWAFKIPGESCRCEVVKERDEARASAVEAYKRGAEAMREACAQWVDHWVSGHVADKLRDMPTPEEP